MSEYNLFDQANKQWEFKKYTKAYKLFLQSAMAGDAYAFNTLGYFLDYGIGVPQDKNAALSWYKKAAKNGDICAYSNIGVFYKEQGNFRQAKFWLSRAIDKGDGDALLEMALL